MIGWASTPYDPYWAQDSRRKAALMSLAGPAANLVLVLVAALLIHAGILLGVFAQPEQVTWTQTTIAQSPGIATGAAIAVSILFSLNLILLVFNLIPVPPLDGSEVLSLFLRESTAQRYRDLMAQPTAQIVGLIVAWNLIGVVLSPIHAAALNLLYPAQDTIDPRRIPICSRRHRYRIDDLLIERNRNDRMPAAEEHG